MSTVELEILTPEWAEPLLAPARFRGAKGGRSGGKSHFYGELAVEEMVVDPALRFVCIREVQRSLKFSVKSLVESKIRQLNVSHLFTILEREIRRNGGSGVMIFEGMQDHTADSIKSLEGFKRAWIEEAQSISQRSLDLLIPTIRAEGSEIWFSWNPDQPEDPVDAFWQSIAGDAFPKSSAVAHGDGWCLAHVNYLDNPFCPSTSHEEARKWQRRDPEGYAHVWLGQYNVKSDAIVLSGKWKVDVFEPQEHWDGPYYGADWGFAQDPTVLVRFWIADSRLYLEYETGGVQWDNDTTEREFRAVPGAAKHVVRADNARPETINEMSKRGLNVQGADKWSGSVEDGIQWLRSFEVIVIHERCQRAVEEARLWRYKTDRLTGDVLPKLKDGNDHVWDAVRYGGAPLIQQGRRLLFG